MNNALKSNNKINFLKIKTKKEKFNLRKWKVI